MIPNPIESMFSTVRECEHHIKRYRGSHMAQRWLAAVCFHCEKGVRRVKGFREIAEVISTIEAGQAAVQKAEAAASSPQPGATTEFQLRT